MTFGSLFSGAGLLDVGLEEAGWDCLWRVEIDKHSQKVLEFHNPWPDTYNDVTKLNSAKLQQVDMIAGGFPCQDVSHASSTGNGLEGKRSGLWAHFHKLICELRPRYVLIENVSALLVRGIDRVLSDLAEVGYDAEWESLCASDFGLPHRRERVFIVAYPNGSDGSEGVGAEQDWPPPVFPAGRSECNFVRVQAPDMSLGSIDGATNKLYLPRGRACGNGVVTPIGYALGRWIADHAKRFGTR